MIETCIYSNIGNRETNEDYVLSKSIGQDVSLHIVADGMGGYKAGDIASRTVAESICAAISRGDSINDAVRHANIDLREQKFQLDIPKMGTTIAGVLLSKSVASIFWSGDSRVYIYRDNKLLYQTEDHSLLNQMLKHRRLTTELEKKYGNIVTRAIMGNEEDGVEQHTESVSSGDEILICSDGLYKDCSIDYLIHTIRDDSYKANMQNELFADNHSFIYVKIV